MKINSENLWEYINNELGTYDKVKLNVYYDDQYVTQIYWNGENFEWEPGKFTSEAFFNPLYDFIVVEEQKKIPKKIEMVGCNVKLNILGNETIVGTDTPLATETCIVKINEIIDYLKSKGDE